MATIGDAATVVDPARQSHIPPRIPSVGIPKWALWLIIVMAVAAVVVVVARNLDMQTQLANTQTQLAKCKAEAAKCVAENNELARQFGVAARISLEKLDEEEASEAAEAPVKEKTPAVDTGTDTTPPPPKAEKQ